MRNEITATLREALVVDWYGSLVASGKIYGDAKGRFADGFELTTSAILAFDPATQTIVTTNSIYKLEPWPNLLRCPHCYQVFAKADAGAVAPVNSEADFDAEPVT